VWSATYDWWAWELIDDLDTDELDNGDVIKVTIGGVAYTKKMPAAGGYDVAAYAADIISLLQQGGVEAVQVGSKVQFGIDTPAGWVGNIELYGSDTTSTLAKKFPSFKSGAWHPFCLFYYDDAGRRSEPVFNDDMRVYVETLPEALGPNVSNNYKRYIDWTVAHLPPQWAKYWRWGYAGNQTIDKFWQYNIASLTQEAKPVGVDTWTKIDISPLQQIDDEDSGYDFYFPNTSIDAYSWEPGDRVRFITMATDGATDYSTLDLMNNNYDYEIKEFDDINNYIYIDPLFSPVGASSTTTTTSPPGIDDTTYIIEIYRPKKQTGTTVYY